VCRVLRRAILGFGTGWARSRPVGPAARARGRLPWEAALASGVPARRTSAGQQGQATTEYALVLLGAAAIALLLVAWATRTGAFGSLLDAVLDSIKRKV
jgi:hypothetical protein